MRAACRGRFVYVIAAIPAIPFIAGHGGAWHVVGPLAVVDSRWTRYRGTGRR